MKLIIERLSEKAAMLFRRPSAESPISEFEEMRDALRPDKVRPIPQPVASAYKVQRRK